jgi:hypothetical protein
MTSFAETQRLLMLTEGLLNVIDFATGKQQGAMMLRVRMNPSDMLTRVAWEPFDLPKGYVQLWFKSGFTCGVSPEGEVSS